MPKQFPATPLDLAEALRQLNQAFDTSDMAAICHAIRETTRLFNVTDLARKAGVERPSLYRAFGGDHPSPNFSTVLAVLDGMNLQLKVIRRKASRKARARQATRSD